MKVLRGGSAETSSNKWFKFDIELDESDLQALTVQHNLAELSVIQKYKLLTKQAELLVTVQMETEGATSDKSAKTLVAEFNALLETLPKVG